MKTHRLGTEGLAVPSLGLGCMGMSQAYGPADESESIATIHRSIELGMTLIDTAISYGRGHNEQLVGRAIADRRDAVTLATKFGIVRGDVGVHLDGSAENARASCEASLGHLGVDHIDLYYLHRVDPEVPVEESIGAMAELVAEGKIRHIGLSEASVDSLERAMAVHPISARGLHARRLPAQQSALSGRELPAQPRPRAGGPRSRWREGRHARPARARLAAGPG